MYLMRDVFTGIAHFVAAAEAGGFTAAATRLDLTPAAVSKAVRQLEAELGVRLFDRTTRRVRLSDEGRRFYARCREAVTAVRAGRDAMAVSRQAPRGEVVVSLSPVLGEALIEALAPLQTRCPDLRVELRFGDHFARLVDEGVDVAVRIGHLDDSSLIARRLCGTRVMTVGAPSYLERRGSPVSLDDLTDHDLIGFRGPDGGVIPWRFSGDGPESGERRVSPQPRLVVDQGLLAVRAAVAGRGLCQGFGRMVAADLAARRLVRVLPDRALDGPPVHALCLPGRQRLPRVRAVIDWLVEAFAPTDEGSLKAR